MSPQRRSRGGESTGGSIRAKDIGRHHCEECICPHGMTLPALRAELAALHQKVEDITSMWTSACAREAQARELLARWRDAMFAHAQPLEEETRAFLRRDEGPRCTTKDACEGHGIVHGVWHGKWCPESPECARDEARGAPEVGGERYRDCPTHGPKGFDCACPRAAPDLRALGEARALLARVQEDDCIGTELWRDIVDFLAGGRDEATNPVGDVTNNPGDEAPLCARCKQRGHATVDCAFPRDPEKP